MSADESWIRLAKLENPKVALALLDYFGGPEQVFEVSEANFVQIQGVTSACAQRIASLSQCPVEDDLKTLERVGARIIAYPDIEYPANLRHIYDPPVVLFVRGEIRQQDSQAIGIVGTRLASEYGKAMAMKIARDLAKRGICVVSGAARGIDTAAHSGALLTGRTIAVLGTGIDIPYPYENRGLLNKIAENGAVISEFAPGARPDAWRFPVRNRLISGLCLGVLVVESSTRGGAIITARLAAEQGRDVWAVPGPSDSPGSRGPHDLIKDGAKLVESAEDILRDLGIEIKIQDENPCALGDIPAEQKAILDILNLHPKHVDEIAAECDLSASVVISSLTMLEMRGLVRKVPGNSYVRSL